MTDMDRFIAAAVAVEVAMAAILNEPGGLPRQLYGPLLELRAAREAITRGTPPAFATSA